MIEVLLREGSLVVRPGGEDFRPRHVSQLAYWGFQRDADGVGFVARLGDSSALANKLVSYLDRMGVEFCIDAELRPILQQQEDAQDALSAAFERCTALKDGNIAAQSFAAFERFLRESLARRLKSHQVKAALHLFTAENGANFSVPGSGKTTVVLSVFEWLRRMGEVDALFVVGPPACFAPWRREYREVLGTDPTCEILAGGDIDERRSRYLIDSDSVGDLYLTTFQTLQRDWEHVVSLFVQQGIRFYFVVDEAHYIKQIGGAWATAVLNVAKHACRRCVLTGTPFPRSYFDAFNLFDVLWPGVSPITQQRRHRIAIAMEHNNAPEAASVLDEAIGPLFYRVRKSDLGLAPQVFHDPIRVRMNENERRLYDSIIERITFASQSDFFRDFDLLVRLRRGRMVRLRQCISYAALLNTAVADYDENILEDDETLASTIHHYDQLELPAKLEALKPLVRTLCGEGEKVVVWSNFVRTLKMIVKHLSALGLRVGLIYGGTPFENATVEDEASRESIIREFTDPRGEMNVLVANPAACAESVSLHKTCAHAVYYDLSYNCAQYLQSLDRIHRVGGSEERPAHYYVLQYEDTLDHDILLNLQQKARNMCVVIDRDYPIYAADMFQDDEELEAYDRLFKPAT